MVGGGDPEVVRFLQLLGEEGALEGDRGLALAAFAGAQAFGGLGVVGDVGGEDQDAATPFGSGRGLDRGARDRVRASAVRLAGLERAGLGAAPDLVQEGQQAQFVELGGRVPGGGALRAYAERRRVGVVGVGDAVVRAVDDGDQGRDAVQDLAGGQVVDRGEAGSPVGELLGAGGGYGAGSGALAAESVRSDRVIGPRCGAALRSGKSGAPAREVHESLPRVCRHRPAPGRPEVRGAFPGRCSTYGKPRG